MTSATRKATFGVVIGVLFALIAISAIYGPGLKNKNGEFIFRSAPVVAKPTVMQPMTLGNGVYYFKTEGKDFGTAVSLFLSAHTCKVEGVVSNNLAGNTHGYFVICR